jgi:exportin-2 (importin alpha re-exporter)
VKAKFWEENGNHPALVRLLQAYIVNGPAVVVPQLVPILGVFQRLVSSKRNDFLGFYLLERYAERK